MKLLIIDCTIRPAEESRTAKLAEKFLKRFLELHPEYEVEKLVLKELNLQPLLDGDIRQRNLLIQNQRWEDSMFARARQFASADRIVVSAPYWDLCFPSLFKIYLEHIFVCGVTFVYEGAKPVGRCLARELMYLQSAGGFLPENDPGRCYMEAVCGMLGINHMTCFCAEGLDVQELDQDAIWKEANDKVLQLAREW